MSDRLRMARLNLRVWMTPGGWLIDAIHIIRYAVCVLALFLVSMIHLGDKL